MDKAELRALYKQIRLRMSLGELSSHSRMINRKLLNEIDWNNYQSVCVFKPIARLNEVDINAVISRLESQGKTVFVLGQTKTEDVPKTKFDLIVVPCIAFDKDNYRLGWGGGFYDKFLASQPQALKIGVSFGNGYTEQLPHEPHDITLDKIITESKTY